MRCKKCVTLLLSLSLMITCAYSQDIHYNYDRSANFASYKTYQWVDLPGPSGAVLDQLIDHDIKRAIDEQLTQKGLTRVESGGDLQVGYHAILREEKAVNLNGFGTGAGPWGWGGGLGSFNSAAVIGQTSTITNGMLMIELYDPAKKQLIWRGDATKTMDIKNNPDKNYKNLQKAMTKLFKSYPPQSDR
jgi:Domain of unknown function (DUF4136)